VPLPKKVAFTIEPVYITKIICGDQHSLAIDNKYNAYSWGSNVCGQLGFESRLKEGEIE